LAIVRTKRERRKAARALVIRLLTTTVLGALIFGAFQAYNVLTTSEKLEVKSVEVRGLARVAPADVEKLIADIRGQNILLVPLEKYQERFAGHPRIRAAAFKKILPNRVICTLEEREPVALVYADGFREVDDEGMVLTSDDLTDFLDLPVITGVSRQSVKEGSLCKEPELVSALKVLGICKRYGGSFANEISELRIGEGGISVVSLKEGMVLLIGESEFEGRLKKFFLIRSTIAKKEEPTKVIDLRFEDQVVLRSGI
jgi:cell division septal protein FtsQ